MYFEFQKFGNCLKNRVSWIWRDHFKLACKWKPRYVDPRYAGTRCTSNSSSNTFWSSKFSMLALDATKGIANGNWNGSWNDEHSFQYNKWDKCKSYILFHSKTITNQFWNNLEIILKSFWSSHLQMMNKRKFLFKNWTS